MHSSMESSHASGNQANHASTQYNGSYRNHTRMSIGTAIFESPRATPFQYLTPTSPFAPDKFYFGPTLTLEEDQDGHEESQHVPTPPPAIDKDDVEYVSEMGIKIRQSYRLVLDQTTGVRATCVTKLRQKVEDQRKRIDTHVKAIQKWPKFPHNVQSDDESMAGSQDEKPDPSPIQRMKDLKDKLRGIHEKLKKAVKAVSQIPKRSKNHRGGRHIQSSKVFKDLTKLVEQTELDIAAIESHVYQRLGCHLPFKTTKSFARLYVSSSATRTLYSHLCQACPVKDQLQGHSHTALVGLVPKEEPNCIVPEDVAITTHHVAIESTFQKGDYIWFEARSRLLLPGCKNEAVYSEPSSLQTAAVIDGLRQRLRRDSGYSSVSTSSSMEQLRVSQAGQGSNEFCRIQVCPGSLAQGSKRLAMCIGDDQESGHQMFYLDEKRRPQTSCEPLNLSEIIQEGEKGRHQHHLVEFKRSRDLRDDRFRIALKIAEATLRYGWREWLGDAWGISDIEFYPVESERRPFLRAEIFNHERGKPGRFMSNLGYVLLELGLWQNLHIRTKGAIYKKELEKHLSRLGRETGAPFQEAVRYCVECPGSDHRDGDDNDFQHIFYEKVINPLREMVKRTESDKSGLLGQARPSS